MRHFLKATAVLLFLVIPLAGCSSNKRIRYLASEVCLVVPMQSTKKDVLTYMGQPQARQEISTESEEWTYFEVRKSTLRKTPYMGKKMGSEEYDLVTVRFNGDIAEKINYRQLSEIEFKALNIQNEPPVDNK